VKVRLLRPPRMEVPREIQQGEHVRLWISARCDLVTETKGDEAKLAILDYEVDPLCRHCGKQI